MTDAFSQYVTLLDEVERIPVAARVSPSLSTDQCAATIAQVVQLVRDRVLPQSDREEAALKSLLGDELASFAGAPGGSGVADHDAILAPVDELARADPQDRARVKELLYRIHAAIAGHFGEAELILAAAGIEERPLRHRAASLDASGRLSSGSSQRAHVGLSTWFG